MEKGESGWRRRVREYEEKHARPPGYIRLRIPGDLDALIADWRRLQKRLRAAELFGAVSRGEW